MYFDVIYLDDPNPQPLPDGLAWSLSLPRFCYGYVFPIPDFNGLSGKAKERRYSEWRKLWTAHIDMLRRRARQLAEKYPDKLGIAARLRQDILRYSDYIEIACLRAYANAKPRGRRKAKRRADTPPMAAGTRTGADADSM